MQAELEYPANRTRILQALTVITALGMALTFYLALFYAGTDTEQGNVQRIFYMHVGGFTGGATAFFITVLAGIAYLVTRNKAWDRLALSSVEIGLPLMTITLITGMVWAKPIWNTWWTGDPRLNSMAVMWLLYAAYLTLRGAISSPEQRARLASVYGILAFVSVIYVFMVIRIRTDTLHPVVIGPSPVNPSAKGEFEVRTDLHIGMTLGIGSIFWMLTAFTLIWHRVRMENMAERVQMLKLRLLSQ
jgi:heme exporter protein C